MLSVWHNGACLFDMWVSQVLKSYHGNYQRTLELNEICFDDQESLLNQLQRKWEGLVSATTRDCLCWGLDSILLAIEVTNDVLCSNSPRRKRKWEI